MARDKAWRHAQRLELLHQKLHGVGDFDADAVFVGFSLDQACRRVYLHRVFIGSLHP